MVDYSSLDGCVLLSLHQNPCWNIWNSTCLRCPKHVSGSKNIWDTAPVTWISHDACSPCCTQQSVLEAGCALFTTSPSTELVLETDFFWFLVNRSSSAAASDLTAALSRIKHNKQALQYRIWNLGPSSKKLHKGKIWDFGNKLGLFWDHFIPFWDF